MAAGPVNSSGAGVFKQVSDMAYSIPSDVTIIDCNRAGLRDRLYVGDAGGQV
jgi:Tfp pilus tip-associated adhesin PilY1